jgi:hypothetical protein
MSEPSAEDRQTTPAGSTVLRHKLNRAGYVKLANAVARDPRLSYRARGVLLDMISRPPDWKFSATRLAKSSPLEGRDAILTALRELETVGYLLRKRERGADGRIRTVVTVSDQPVREWAERAGVDAERRRAETLAGRDKAAMDEASDNTSEDDEAWFFGEAAAAAASLGGHNDLDFADYLKLFPLFGPKTAQPDSVNPSSIEGRGYEEHTDKTCPPLASLAADAPNDFDPTWRDQDRELFADLLGGHEVQTDGSKWRKGRFTVDALYNGYRKVRGKKWPGRWLLQTEENNGLEDWLIDEGVTVIVRDPNW